MTALPFSPKPRSLRDYCLGLLALLLLGSVANAAVLQWEAGSGFRRAKLPPLGPGKPGFRLLPPATTGVSFTNVLPEARIMANANLLNGSGVALGDYDGDGFCDIYLCDLNGTNALYRNLGDWKFTNVTAQAGVGCPGQTSTGAVFADLNGDSHPDLLVTSMGGPNACFVNNGHGGFTNVTAGAGLVSRLGSASMALADIDGNGTLDLYVANYGATSLLRSGGSLAYRMVDGKPVVSGRNAKRIKVIDGVMYELGEPDTLYLNDGTGKFRAVSWSDGTFLDENGKALAEAPWDQGLTVMFRDFNEDGFPDIYVCNDASTPDRFWLNDGHGRFRPIDPLAQRQTSYFSMCGDCADLDRDGHSEFMVLDMLSRDHRLRLSQLSDMHPQPRVIGEISNQPQVRRNTLFHARGDGTYAEIAQFSGVAASEWSWSVLFVDVDLDGWEDALVANGFPYDMDNLDMRERIRTMGRQSVADSRRNVLMYPRLETPNIAFRNEHDLTFRETGAEWGFDSKQVCNGMALADLDNDGDLDVVVSSLNGPALLYRNDSTAARLVVRLKGLSPNSQGIGAKIKVTGGPVPQTQEVICGGRYVSGDDPMRVFAAGTATNLSIEISWRSGRTSVISGAQPNCIYEIDEAAAQTAPQTARVSVEPFFQDVSQLLNHTHHEDPFDDTVRQPLVTRSLSQQGPGVAWYDFNGDGFEDLAIGTGKGGTVAVFINNGKGGFTRLKDAALDAPAKDDVGSVLGMRTAGGEVRLFAGSGNYESNADTTPSALQYVVAPSGLAPRESFPPVAPCTGPMALGDVDGDGALDIFVGGRVLPGQYPLATSSRIYLQRSGKFVLDEVNSTSLTNVGLVNGALFSDVNGDGVADLILACDWGPVRVFMNEKGRLIESTAKLGLTKYPGWWNGVTAGDFDGDGKLDIIASNWGANTRYQHHRSRPLRIYYGDFDGNGTVDIVESYYEPGMGKYVPERLLEPLSRGLPRLRERFPDHKSYSEAGVEQVLGDRQTAAHLVEASCLETTLFLNRGDHFEARPLPFEAQIAPTFGVAVGDLDGDGKEDVVLAQNFFATFPDTSRHDAGRGLWLRGDGMGGFAAVTGQVSGIKVYGEQRGCALADYDGDGRVDIVFTQNSALTKLYNNAKARQGLTVRLKGPTANPDGVGASMRLFFGGKAGPVREVHAGSGYWSQDSSLQVLATPQTPTQVWVRWPGGKIVTKEVGANTTRVEVSYE